MAGGTDGPYRRARWRRPRRSTRGPLSSVRVPATTRPVSGAPDDRRGEPDSRGDVAVAPAAPAADDPVDRRPDRDHRGLRLSQRRRSSRRSRRLILAANPAAGAGGVPGVLRGLPAARLSLGDPAARHGRARLDQGLHRDHLPVLAGQLRRAGQARRRLSRLPAEDQQPDRVAVADVRDGLHRARARPVRDRDPRPRRGLLELPQRAAAGHPGRLRDRRRRRRGRWRSALLTMRNFGRQIIVALPLPHQILELYDRFEEGVFGALVDRGICRASAS